MEANFGRNSMAVLFLLPYLFIVTDLSLAATYASLIQIRKGERPLCGVTMAQVRDRLRKLIVASLVVGILYSLGFLALIIPGLLLMTLYLFVPLLVMSEPDSALTIYLNRSRRVVGLAPTRTFLVILIIFSLGLAMNYGTEIAMARFLENKVSPVVRVLLTLFVNSGLAMFWGALTSIFVVEYFLVLKTRLDEGISQKA